MVDIDKPKLPGYWSKHFENLESVVENLPKDAEYYFITHPPPYFTIEWPDALVAIVDGWFMMLTTGPFIFWSESERTTNFLQPPLHALGPISVNRIKLIHRLRLWT